MKGQSIETMTWPEAQTALGQFGVILLPLGARSKEHGHHLPLNTDWILADYLTRHVLDRYPALALPVVQYGYYPAFTEYPGSIHIGRQTCTDTVIDICLSLARHSTARFYVLNTGISTNWALEPARLALAQKDILMEYTDLTDWLDDITKPIEQQPCGTHADEIETSMMLYIRPEVVKMDLARPDTNPQRGRGPLTRDPKAPKGVYSPTGVWGDPTLATADKGRIVVEALVDRIVAFLNAFGRAEYKPGAARDRYLDR